MLSHVELRFDPPPPVEAMGLPEYTEVHEREPAMADEDRAMLGSGYAPPPPPPRRGPGNDGASARGGGQPADSRSPWAGTGRNAQCPCGSGKKFKHCHGRV